MWEHKQEFGRGEPDRGLNEGFFELSEVESDWGQVRP